MRECVIYTSYNDINSSRSQNKESTRASHRSIVRPITGFLSIFRILAPPNVLDSPTTVPNRFVLSFILFVIFVIFVRTTRCPVGRKIPPSNPRRRQRPRPYHPVVPRNVAVQPADAFFVLWSTGDRENEHHLFAVPRTVRQPKTRPLCVGHQCLVRLWD